jgi:hypothetical protein
LSKKISNKKIKEIVRLREEEHLSTREIGKKLKISKDVAHKYLSKHGLSGNLGESPEHFKVDQIIDKTEVDGSIEVLKMEKPISPEELMTLCQLDKNKWLPQYYKGNIWQGFYKLKHYLPDHLLQKLVDMAKNGSSLQEIKQVIESPQHGHKKVNLIQSKLQCKRIVEKHLEDAILEFNHLHSKPIPKKQLPVGKYRKKSGESFMLAWGCHDSHLGSYAFGEETGGGDYDINIACNRVLNSIDDMILEIAPYRIEKILMPIGSDFLHVDSYRMKTTFGEHVLDTDTRFSKVYLSGLRCLSYMVERALEIVEKEIELLYVPGNHDGTSSFTLIAALAERFRNDKRVKVDLNPMPRKWRTYGTCLIAFDHGHKFNAHRSAVALSMEAKEVWNTLTYRECQMGHFHQRSETMYKGLTPTNGVLFRVNPSLCSIDSWHAEQKFLGEPTKSVESWRYSKFGYMGSHVSWARDDNHKFNN